MSASSAVGDALDRNADVMAVRVVGIFITPVSVGMDIRGILASLLEIVVYK